MSAILLATIALVSSEAMAFNVAGAESLDNPAGRFIPRNPLYKKDVESGAESQSVGLEVTLTTTSMTKASVEEATGEPIVDGGITTIGYNEPANSAAAAEPSSTQAGAAGVGVAGKGGSAESGPGGSANAGEDGSASSGSTGGSGSESSGEAESSAEEYSTSVESYTTAIESEVVGESSFATVYGEESGLETSYGPGPIATGQGAGSNVTEPISESGLATATGASNNTAVVESWKSLVTDVATPTGNTSISTSDAYGGGIAEVSGTSSDGIVWSNNANIASISIGAIVVMLLL